MIGPPRVIRRTPLGEGDAAAYQVIAEMADLVRRDRSEEVRQLAAAAHAATLGGGPSDDMHAVYRILRGPAYKFKADPIDAETIKTPRRQAREIIERGYAEGDCDDRATLGAAMLRALGLPAYFVLVAERPGVDFHHVYYASSEPSLTPPRGVDMRVVVPFDPQERVPAGSWARWDRREVFRV